MPTNVIKSEELVGTLSQINAETVTDKNTLFVIDFPNTAITNAQMESALTTYSSYFKVGEIYICGDDGTNYSKGTAYQFTLTGTTYSWEPVTSMSRSKRSDTGYSEAIVNGWTVGIYPDGEIVATAELDYDVGTDFTWSSETIGYLQETLPVGVFGTVISCDCKVIDITPGATYINSMNLSINELFGTVATDKVAVMPLEYVYGNSNYAAPTKLHAVWTVRGV